MCEWNAFYFHLNRNEKFPWRWQLSTLVLYSRKGVGKNMSCSWVPRSMSRRTGESFDVFKRDVSEMCCLGSPSNITRDLNSSLFISWVKLLKKFYEYKNAEKRRERKLSVSNGKQKSIRIVRKRIKENHAENTLIIRYTKRNAWYIHVYNLTNGQRNDAGTTGKGPSCTFHILACLIYGRIIKIQRKFFLPFPLCEDNLWDGALTVIYHNMDEQR